MYHHLYIKTYKKHLDERVYLDDVPFSIFGTSELFVSVGERHTVSQKIRNGKKCGGLLWRIVQKDLFDVVVTSSFDDGLQLELIERDGCVHKIFIPSGGSVEQHLKYDYGTGDALKAVIYCE